MAASNSPTHLSWPKPRHVLCREFPTDVWDPPRKILHFVTFITSSYLNKAREMSGHFFMNREGIEPDLL